MTQTIMAREAAESPKVIRDQLRANHQLCNQLATTLKGMNPSLVFLIGTLRLDALSLPDLVTTVRPVHRHREG